MQFFLVAIKWLQKKKILANDSCREPQLIIFYCNSMLKTNIYLCILIVSMFASMNLPIYISILITLNLKGIEAQHFYDGCHTSFPICTYFLTWQLHQIVLLMWVKNQCVSSIWSQDSEFLTYSSYMRLPTNNLSTTLHI
jgi:hypothetical protein